MRSEITADLVAMVVGVEAEHPFVLALGDPAELPSGRLQPSYHSLQAGVRRWVERQTGRHLGYVEQLYTFAEIDSAQSTVSNLSVSYLGLTRDVHPRADWRAWYDLLPWEDRRTKSSLVQDDLVPLLSQWATQPRSAALRASRQLRVDVTFGLNEHRWIPDLALSRYELLWEAGLVAESPESKSNFGTPMAGHHRRIFATGMSRLRSKIQYRPVVFELMADSFTLGQLQTCVEAIAGQKLHTQNFRRLIESEQLVEETGERDAATGGRPAKLYRFRRDVLDERFATGTRLPRTR